VVQLKLDKAFAWINNQQDWPDVYGLGPRGDLRRLRHQLVLPPRPAGREGIRRRRTRRRIPGVQIKVPATSTTTATWPRASCCARSERAGSTNNIKVIKELEGLKVSARDRLQHFDAYMNPATHQMQQTIYMATYNEQPAEKDDIFKILSSVPPQEVEDKEAPGRLQARELRSDADV
jgi:branched-chain amino acid transport system substrate-binding protein